MKEKPKKVWSVFPSIINFFTVPIFIVGFFALMVLVLSMPSGAMPSVFGISFVRIESGSMVERGFDVGNVVLMNQNYQKPLKKGDIIAFYLKKDEFDEESYDFEAYRRPNYSVEGSKLVTIERFEGDFAKKVDYSNTRTNPQTLKDNRNNKIYFHEIVNVYVSPDGIVFYETQGSNPSSTPDGLVRQDFVLAKYHYTPLILKAIMTFSTTLPGIILLVFVPLSLIAGVELYNLLKKLYALWLEDSVFNRKISYKDEKVKEYKINQIMSISKKAYFWVTAQKNEKTETFNFLYKISNEKNEKQNSTYKTALKAREIFEKKGAFEYFKFWHLTANKKFDKKEIVKFQKLYESNILKSNEQKLDKKSLTDSNQKK